MRNLRYNSDEIIVLEIRDYYTSLVISLVIDISSLVIDIFEVNKNNKSFVKS